MDGFLIKMGELFCIFILTFITLGVVDIVDSIIKDIKNRKNKTIIKKGTMFFNHDKSIKFKLKKDLVLKFKKDKVIKVEINDKRLYGTSWGINKQQAQSELEKQLVEYVYYDYKNNRDSVLITDYVEDIRELN